VWSVQSRQDVVTQRIIRQRNETPVVERAGELIVLTQRQHLEMILIDASDRFSGLRAFRTQFDHQAIERRNARCSRRNDRQNPSGDRAQRG
jgi:hypothetical protein